MTFEEAKARSDYQFDINETAYLRTAIRIEELLYW